jgi:hypothetical protein
MTVDWSRWLEISDEERERLRAQYRKILSDEAKDCNWRWNAMSPAERAAYPKA